MGDPAIHPHSSWRNRCEVWVGSLTELRQHEQELASALTPVERAQVAARADAGTATLSRAALRLVLARYLGVRAEQLEIDRRCPGCGRPHGRPRLLTAPGGTGPLLEFSVSHGGDLLVLAFAGPARVGVDVEPEPRGNAAAAELLELTLTATERDHVASAGADQREWLFLHYWTGKEAVLKALGTGLDVSLHSVTLPPPPGGGTTEVRVADSGPVELAVRYLDLGPGHVCALATEDPVLDLHVHRLSPRALLAPS